MGPDDSDSSDEEEDEEELYTRGRSRSRSVHANDSGSDSFMVNEGEDYSGSAPETPQSEMVDDGRGKAERTGPLQQREVVALQKVGGLHCVSLFAHLHACRVWKRPPSR